MVYVCLLYAGKFLQKQQPYAAMTIPMLYGSDKGWCMVAGHQAAECPVNPTYDGWWWPKESVHLDETRWCSKENVVEWDRSGERYGDPPQAKWGTKKFQGTCCYYPPIEEVYDARYVKIQIWDEDTFTNNDMLGEFNVDLKEAAESGKGFGVWNYDFDVQELKKNGQAENNVFKAKVRVQWERPHDNAIATTYDLSPGKWHPDGYSLTASNPPWETHGFSPPPPYSCDCRWTAKWACPPRTGSVGTARADGSACFEFCCQGGVSKLVADAAPLERDASAVEIGPVPAAAALLALLLAALAVASARRRRLGFGTVGPEPPATPAAEPSAVKQPSMH